VVRWVVLPYLVLSAAAILVVRRRDRATLDRMRRFNKRALNPVMLKLAGRPHWYAARVEHVGRRSGRPYATPVVATRVPGGYAIALPYGTGVDWCRNLQAAGDGVIVLDGQRHMVTDPQVVSSAAIQDELPDRMRLATRVYGFTDWLRLSDAPPR
jgi:deazaflavin-dependent oxidoreductase (nitroreductase family)